MDPSLPNIFGKLGIPLTRPEDLRLTCSRPFFFKCKIDTRACKFFGWQHSVRAFQKVCHLLTRQSAELLVMVHGNGIINC
jgi:hypothetical protein